MNRQTCVGAAAAALAFLVLSNLGAAQPSARTSGIEAVHVVYHNWMPVEGIGADSMRVLGVQQLAAPLNFRFGQMSRVSFDISGAYAQTRIKVRQGDSIATLSLNGPTDIRGLLTITGVRDHVAFLIGGTAPSGLTSLSPSELSALGVVAAPAVRSPVAGFGGGAGGSAGATVAIPVKQWTFTGGGGYERRFSYVPFNELVVGTPVDASISPGAVISLSGRLDGEVVGTAITLDVGLRQFYSDTFAVSQGGRKVQSVYQLGPLSDLAVRIQPTTAKARDVVFSASLQRRAAYEVLDRGPVAGSDASFKSAGAAGTLLRAGGWRIGAGIETRSYSGIKSDSTLVAAAYSELAGSLNFVVPLNGGEFVITTAGSTGTVTLLNKPAVAMRRFTIHAQIQAF